VIGACLWLDRAGWGRLGGFPEWIGSIGEDMYLCCVARLRGWPVRCTADAGYRHRQGASFGGNRAIAGLASTYRRRALSERNKTWVLWLCTPGAVMWPLLAVHLLLLSAEGGVLSLLRLDGRVWREIYGPAVAAVLSPAGDRYRLRQRLQSTRQVGHRRWWRGFVWMPRKLALLLSYGLPEVR